MFRKQSQQPQQQNYSSDLDMDIGLSGNYSSGYYPEKEEEVIKIQLDVDKELKKFEYEVLRGKMQVIKNDEKVWEDIAPGEKPPVNELGVRELLSRLKGRVTTIAKLSYKTDEEIYKDMFYFDMSISELIGKRCGNWEMNPEMAKSIKDAIIELVWDVLASSRDGFTAINLRSQYSKQDVSRTDSTDRSGGTSRSFLGIPMGRK